MPEFILKGAEIYSKACNIVKTIPKNIVPPRPSKVCILLPYTSALCAQVNNIPEDSKITVFISGIP